MGSWRISCKNLESEAHSEGSTFIGLRIYEDGSSETFSGKVLP